MVIMSMSHNTSLNESIAEFHRAYGSHMQTLAELMNTVGMSHYSSGCGGKQITFQLFPCAPYVEEMLSMVSLERAHKSRVYNGFKDASSTGDYNPGVLFLHFLQRWSRFAEQIMRYEGDRPRGVAAARAKIIMDEMFAALNRIPPVSGKVQNRLSPFAAMMRDIGITLEKQERQLVTQERQDEKENTQHNYERAMAAARAEMQDTLASSLRQVA